MLRMNQVHVAGRNTMRMIRTAAVALVAGGCWTLLAQPAQAQEEQESASTTELRFAAQRRDPPTAFAMSLIVGFGAGHFYASQWLPGAAFASTQALGVLVAGVGIGLQGAEDEATIDAGTALLVGGSVVFGLSRVLDAATAPISAHDRNDELLVELGVTPVFGQNGHVGLAAVGRF